MEKAILKTLIYSSIFDYPLKINEIHKWLIGKKATLRQIERVLYRVSSIKYYGRYYFLGRRKNLISKRRLREKQSAGYFQKAKILAQILKVVPWIKLVGISGGLAMNNAGKSDDIDLFIITSKNRLWISRLLAIGLLSLVGQRRKRVDKGKRIAGKICLNILLEEDKLEQKNKDLYVVHEVLQMKPLWYRDGIYSKYLEDNSWVFKFLPNWTTALSSPRRRRFKEASTLGVRGSNKQSKMVNWIPAFAGMTMEKLAKWLQLRIMQKPQGLERIEEGALYFHPRDCRLKVLSEYKMKIKKFLTMP